MVFWFIWFITLLIKCYPNPVWLAYTCPVNAITTTIANAPMNSPTKAISTTLSIVLM